RPHPGNGRAPWFRGDQFHARPRVRFAHPGYGSRTSLPSHAREPARSCTHNRAADLLTPRTPNPSASEEADDWPCTPVAPRTLTSKHAPVGRGEVAAFCSPDKAEGRIRGWRCGLVPRRRPLHARPRVRFAYPGYTSATTTCIPSGEMHYLRVTGARMP